MHVANNFNSNVMVARVFSKIFIQVTLRSWLVLSRKKNPIVLHQMKEYN